MKRLGRPDVLRHADLVARVTVARDALNAAIREYNRQVKDMHAVLLVPKVQEVNDAVEACNAFVDEVHSDQENYYEDRSDNWREGDAGQSYSDWMSSWELELDELALEEPTPFDEVELDVDEFERLEEECPS